MINTKIKLEKFLQKQRFKRVLKFLHGDVLDFGGNDAELEQYVQNGSYTVVNYDHSPMEGRSFDTIIMLAVVEHIEIEDVYKIYKKFNACIKDGGKVYLTTPTLASKPVLEFLAAIKFLDKQNIEEHKHYWNKKELYDLADKSGFTVDNYEKFQLGFNQYMILSKKK